MGLKSKSGRFQNLRVTLANVEFLQLHGGYLHFWRLVPACADTPVTNLKARGRFGQFQGAFIFHLDYLRPELLTVNYIVALLDSLWYSGFLDGEAHAEIPSFI